MGFALARRIPVLPVAIDGMPYGFMSKFQAMKAREMSAPEIALRIVDWLVATPTAQEPMTDGLVSAFERSGSFEKTRRLVAFLEKMPRFTPAQLDRLDAAAKTNDQVEKANLNGTEVPEIVKALIRRHGGTTSPPEYDPWSDEPPF